jgi:carbamoyltransferase
VVHVDNTSRVQIVHRQANPLYWQVIQEYFDLSDVPVILNTSFNVKGEPIVCTPDDAINTFLNSGLDYVVIGHFLVSKKPN